MRHETVDKIKQYIIEMIVANGGAPRMAMFDCIFKTILMESIERQDIICVSKSS